MPRRPQPHVIRLFGAPFGEGPDVFMIFERLEEPGRPLLYRMAKEDIPLLMKQLARAAQSTSDTGRDNSTLLRNLPLTGDELTEPDADLH